MCCSALLGISGRRRSPSNRLRRRRASNGLRESARIIRVRCLCGLSTAPSMVERTLVNARIGLARGVWSLGLWGSNLTDVSYIRAVASRPRVYFPTTQRPQDLIFGDGRRVGLGLNVKF